MTTQLQAQQAFAATLKRDVQALTIRRDVQGWGGAMLVAGSRVTLEWERSHLVYDPTPRLVHVFTVYGFDNRNRYSCAPGVPDTLLEAIYFLTCENIPK